MRGAGRDDHGDDGEFVSAVGAAVSAGAVDGVRGCNVVVDVGYVVDVQAGVPVVPVGDAAAG